MNFAFYLFGNPDGFNQYPMDVSSKKFSNIILNTGSESQLTIIRDEQLLYYIYQNLLQERGSAFLGFCIVFNGVYCKSPQSFFDFFSRAFYDVQMKGEILKFENGKCVYSISKFTEKPLEFERINAYFKNGLETSFKREFLAIPASFKVGNGTKEISIKEYESDILSAISQYDVVHIINSEKSSSELEKVHARLTNLYHEKQTLEKKYSKLSSQKKQYKLVAFLSLIVIGCIGGLLLFTKNLQSKDSLIVSQRQEISSKSQELLALTSNYDELKQRQITLGENNRVIKCENDTLHSKVAELQLFNNDFVVANEQLNTELLNKNSRISDLESQINSYRSENYDLENRNRQLSSDVENYKRYVPKSYYVNSDAQYYYQYRCNQSYEKTNCYTSAGNYVKVYTISNGYGLTENGWVGMYNLSK